MEKKHLEVILEDIKGKFELVLEGHEVLRKEIQDAKRESNERHDHTAFLIETLNKKVDNINDDLSKKIKGVDDKLSRKIDGVEDKLSKRIDGLEDKLTKRIDGVEDKLSREIDAVAADLAAHRADTEVHKSVYKIKE